MHDLAQRLIRKIREHEFLRPGDRVAVAVSGGADSVALFFLLEELRAELGIVLSIAHVNHKLRAAESDEDERFVAQLAASHDLEFHSADAPIPGRAAMISANLGAECGANAGTAFGPSSGIEAAARALRYDFFRDLIRRGCVNRIATAHTLDDQAETVLLRMFRGTGIRGLAGIHPKLASEVVRPLLTFRRAELRDYLRARKQTWRDDSSNNDPAFLRNRVRQRLLPMITDEFGDAAIQHIAELAEIARAEEEYWAEKISEWNAGSRAVEVTPTLEAKPLLAQPLAAQRRQVRAWLHAHAPEAGISFALIEEILELARGPAGKKIALPGSGMPARTKRSADSLPAVSARDVRRTRTALELQRAPAPGADQSAHYEYTLPVPGIITVPELNARIEARIVNVADLPPDRRGNLLDPACTSAMLTLRNWRPGDRYWPAHTASEKKVKELLADRHATGAKKKLWPVAVDASGTLVWMRGFHAPASLRPRSSQAISIREIAGLM
ncbi:MAG: tRNA lysidine(34) synthetase TilS [Terriglobales bacterium]